MGCSPCPELTVGFRPISSHLPSVLWLEKLLRKLQTPNVFFHSILLHDSAAGVPSSGFLPHTHHQSCSHPCLLHQQVTFRDENVKLSLSFCRVRVVTPPPSVF